MRLLFSLLLTINAFSQPMVSIENGYGEGQYLEGDTVHIWAEFSLLTEYFHYWSSDNAAMVDSLEWHTSFIMPNQNVHIQGNILAVDSLLIDFEVIDGVNNPKNVYLILQDNAIGTIFLFHGSGGSAANIVSRVEPLHFIQDAKYAGYNVIITDSENATLEIPNSQNRWDLNNWSIDTNIDIQNIQVILSNLINDGTIDPNIPIFSAGVSNGGNFASVIAYVLNWNGAVLFCSQGNPTELYDLTEIPTMFNVGNYDPALGGAEMNYNKLVSRNIITEFHVLDRSPFHPNRLTKIPEIDSSLSSSIYQEFLQNGIIDSNHYFQYLDDEIAQIILQNPGSYPIMTSINSDLRNAVFDQIKVITADHSFFSDYNKRVFQFIILSSENDFLQGDLNEDDILNILDIVLLINIILDGGFSNIGDLNEDGINNILDIVILANLILNT